jgi:hypothetical protein
VNKNGRFIFPLKVRNGQQYEMAITKDPDNQKCRIDHPRGVSNSPQSTVHVACTTTGPIQISTTGCSAHIRLHLLMCFMEQDAPVFSAMEGALLQTMPFVVDGQLDVL